ncbi:hypothetical protein [Candidatus Wolbachia massiliensis]|uniref:Uncharacterized protein n=1 Tax=Candidatus Wolbachia massiliensis TaxID=1845000 RepID=A0A7M3U2S9_9RICK|nr:hypothetical protein [Candidatus Wolbachia massiliensis]QOD38714.1 hypothetical protein ID128_02575 [Candidatus Wolbachia massiliensis]
MNNVLLKGGRTRRNSFYDDRLSHATYGFSYEVFAECEEIDNRLKDIAYESIVNKSEQTQKDKLEVERDNGYFYAKYPQDSVVEVARILNNKNNEDLKIKVGVLQIGKSVVKVENAGGIRNYTDLTDDSDIVLTFHTSLGKLEVRLYPDTQNRDLIKVEVRDQDMLEKLKDRKEKIGKNCLLGGLPVSEAIDQKGFFKPGLMNAEVTSQSNEKIKENSWVVREEIRRALNFTRERA